ncbi:MAG: hypothetical protein O7G86_03140 [Gammaproteobacteria bacterium]|nr:hypothetical protein [Gammaproteobacteria bacterium]MCZ6852893.1 hypothetical protein [Gammaproteobacteria bacterium]
MAWKICLTACLFFCCAELANSPFTDPDDPGLQKTDTNRPISRQRTVATTTLKNIRSAAPANQSTPFADGNSDIQANRYPLYAADLESLISSGSLSLPHPEGGTLNIILRTNTTRHGSRILHVSTNGYPGTITQRPNGFFATLATPEGIYTLESRGSETYLVQQRQLDLRINPALKDYVHAPAA